MPNFFILRLSSISDMLDNLLCKCVNSRGLPPNVRMVVRQEVVLDYSPFKSSTHGLAYQLGST
jgi:hypothetical protein